MFHSADDVVFSVANSDALVRSLRRVGGRDAVRYTRFDRDQEGYAGTAVQGHSTGITMSRQAEVYSWMLSMT
eukprot:2343998-Prymnesium_polylepis.1